MARIKRGIIKRIHVNMHVIKRNQKTGECEPVITVKQSRGNTYGHQVILYGQDGKPAAVVKYSPEKPLSCGAHVWIETTNEVEVVDAHGSKPEREDAQPRRPSSSPSSRSMARKARLHQMWRDEEA